jgi:hypothetical protein
MAESTVGSSTKGEVLVDFLDRPKKPAKKPMVGAGMASGTTNRGMTSGNAMKPPEVTPIDDLMGMAFDASVRKGIDAGRAYLMAKMKRDGRSDAVISSQLQKFDDSIGQQQALKLQEGLGEGVINAYRDKNVRKGMTPSKAQDYALNQKRVNATNASMANAGRAVTNVFKGPKTTPQMQSARDSYNTGSSF